MNQKSAQIIESKIKNALKRKDFESIILNLAKKHKSALTALEIKELLSNQIYTPSRIAKFLAETILPSAQEENPCVFSPCRQFRYQLTHSWEPMFEQKEIAFIGLNPSTADENQLDPTLRRIKGFCQSWGYNKFHMLNLFALRSTDPKGLKEVHDPIGPENNATLKKYAESNIPVIFCWGTNAHLFSRDNQVFQIFERFNPQCISISKIGYPEHPLYLKADLQPKDFPECLMASIKELKKHFNPFKSNPWNGEELSKSDIESARLNTTSGNLPCISRDPTSKHIQRIAYLLNNPDTTPIDIDMGVEGTDAHPYIEDGWHRFAAAIMRKQTRIPVTIQGEISQINQIISPKK
jgi:hypothetical protein